MRGLESVAYQLDQLIHRASPAGSMTLSGAWLGQLLVTDPKISPSPLWCEGDRDL